MDVYYGSGHVMLLDGEQFALFQQLHIPSTNGSSSAPVVLLEVHRLLNEFSHLFIEPTELSP